MRNESGEADESCYANSLGRSTEPVPLDRNEEMALVLQIRQSCVRTVDRGLETSQNHRNRIAKEAKPARWAPRSCEPRNSMQPLVTDSALAGVSQDFASEIPFIASQAAIELDNLLLGKSAHLVAVSQLADYLKSSTASEYKGSAGAHLLNSQAFEVVSRAIDASGELAINTFEDFHIRADQLVSQLKGAMLGGDEGIIERLRSFCVSLSEVATAQRQAMIEMEPSHPYRG